MRRAQKLQKRQLRNARTTRQRRFSASWPELDRRERVWSTGLEWASLLSVLAAGITRGRCENWNCSHCWQDVTGPGSTFNEADEKAVRVSANLKCNCPTPSSCSAFPSTRAFRPEFSPHRQLSGHEPRLRTLPVQRRALIAPLPLLTRVAPILFHGRPDHRPARRRRRRAAAL